MKLGDYLIARGKYEEELTEKIKIEQAKTDEKDEESEATE